MIQTELGRRTLASMDDNELLELLEDYRVLASFVENSTDAIQISDRNLVTIRINRAYEILTGINRDELVGVPVAELVQKNLISESAGALVRRDGRPHTIVQHFPRTGRSAHVSCKPVYDRDGEIEFFICNDRDLDEISNLKSQLTEVSHLKDQYLAELEKLKSREQTRSSMIVEDREMLKVLSLAARVAKVDSTALLLGETGVGKDELARFIHANSPRADKKFVSINCGAITESLIESELFGYEAHAFTGAGNKAKAGLFEVADGGTIFLDEVGELSLNMQTKLLHVLQSHTFMRVGGSKTLTTDIRVISATNRDLAQMVAERSFREDLYYRLNVVPIHIPPLRERKNDIIPLAQSFLVHYNQKYGYDKKLSPTACYTLLNAHWEGNVRQLKNAVEQAVIMCDGDTIQPEHLPVRGGALPAVTGAGIPLAPAAMEGQSLTEMLERTEKQYLDLAYERHGSVREAAKSLGMSSATFQRHKAELDRKYGS